MLFLKIALNSLQLEEKLLKFYKIKKLMLELMEELEEIEDSLLALWMSLPLKRPDKVTEFFMILKVDSFLNPLKKMKLKLNY